MSLVYKFIHREEGNYVLARMIEWAGVSASGYFDWRGRPASSRAQRRAYLTELVRWRFEDSDGTYGYRRIAAALNRAGVKVHHGTVASIMREEGLVAAQPNRRGPRTTVRGPAVAEVPDLLGRDFTATEPGVKLVGDITYISTWEGFAYLAVVLDCYSKMVVGWAIADHMRTDLILSAMGMAHRNGRIRSGGSVFHSDRGSQYMSSDFSSYCESIGVSRSVGRTGVCWDNAWAESWNGTLKNERVNRMVYPTRKKAEQDIASWIELRYNRKRLHSALGYRTPYEVDQQWRNREPAA